MNRLDETLRALPDSMDWPEPSPHMPARVSAIIESHEATGRLRWVWVSAVSALVLAIALLPGARQAVADLLVEAGVRIGVVDEIPPLGADLELGEEVTLHDAARVVSFEVRVPGEMGPPDGIFLDGETISLTWGGDGSLPSAPGTDVAMLLTQAPSGETRATKGVSPETELLPVTIDGSSALWIEGAEHTFTLVDNEGELIEETTRLAANVLLWSADGVDFRLELTGGLDRALSIARSLEVR